MAASPMDSSGSPYAAASPEAGPKRGPHPRSPTSGSPRAPPSPLEQDEQERQTHLRFLVSNTEAGCIIGKGGSTINELQTQTGARIQVSRNHELFPGTPDRVIMVSGGFDQVMKAIELILKILSSEGSESNENEYRSRIRLVVPNSSCGGVIGKGGATIKSFIEESNAGIKISALDANQAGLHDRLVTVSGSLDNRIRAISLILSKLLEDGHYPPNLNSPFPYGGVNYPGYTGVPVGYMVPPMQYNNANYGGPNGHGGRYTSNKANASAARSPGTNDSHGITIGVADEHVGAIVGRAGRNIMEISQISGARIKISDRGDFIAGTSDRKVTISGSPEAVRAAEAMIMQKVSESQDR